MHDALGDRMKRCYEDRTRVLLPRRTNMIVRVDGRAFHTLTRDLERPFDAALAGWMDSVCVALCEEIQGAKMGFVQSDEASVWATDYDTLQTEAWFDGNVQKVASLAASIATRAFCVWRNATFDGRAFTVPALDEVANYFIWRQQDATRNSISMAAQAHFSHKELHGKGVNEMQEMLFQGKGINWSDYPVGFKRGRAVVRVTTVGQAKWTDKAGVEHVEENVERSEWRVEDPPVFTADRDYILNRAPTPHRRDARGEAL